VREYPVFILRLGELFLEKIFVFSAFIVLTSDASDQVLSLDCYSIGLINMLHMMGKVLYSAPTPCLSSSIPEI